MNGYELPVTGATTYAIGDLVFGQGALALVAIGIVAVGVVLVRLSFRRGKAISDV